MSQLSKPLPKPPKPTPLRLVPSCCSPTGTCSTAKATLEPKSPGGVVTASVRALVPSHPVCAEALAMAKFSLPPSILYCSLRVYMYAHAFHKMFSDCNTPGTPSSSSSTTSSEGSAPMTPNSPDIKIPKTPQSTGSSRNVTQTTPQRSNGTKNADGTRNSPVPSARPESGASNRSTSGPTYPSQTKPGDSSVSGSGPRYPATTSTPPHILFVACILHLAGTSPEHDTTPERFEVVSADLAAALLRKHSIDDFLVREVWLALSLHTSPGIAERLGGIIRAVRLAVRADFGSYPLPKPEALPGGVETMGVIRWKLPRLEIERDLEDRVVRQAEGEGHKAPGGSWVGDLMRDRKVKEEGVGKVFTGRFREDVC